MIFWWRSVKPLRVLTIETFLSWFISQTFVLIIIRTPVLCQARICILKGEIPGIMTLALLQLEGNNLYELRSWHFFPGSFFLHWIELSNRMSRSGLITMVFQGNKGFICR